jgi:hypothetical protein
MEGLLSIVVSLREPYPISSVLSRQHRIFGYHLRDLVGRPLSILEGSKTNLESQTLALESVSSGEQSADFFQIFYDAESKPISFYVVCTPNFDHHGNRCARLTMEPSAAIQLSEVFRDPGLVWALVIPTWPFTVSAASDSFISQFGYSGPEVIGQSLFRMKTTEDDSTIWERTLTRAAKGKREVSTVDTTSAAGVVTRVLLTCIPVMGTDMARIGFVLACFASSGSHDDQNTATTSTPSR